MKKIGYTDGGGVIVSLTQSEWTALKALAERMNGKEYKSAYIIPFDNGDMEPALQAVLAWLDTSFAVGQLQEVVDSLKNSLVPPKFAEE